MNLKTIIPISLTIIIVASVIGIILNEYPKDEEPCPPLCDYDQDELKHQIDNSTGPEQPSDTNSPDTQGYIPFVQTAETKIKITDSVTFKLIHNLEINYFRPEQSMDGVHNTNFTEACHSSNTIHANFTDGKVITTSDDCN